MPFAPSLPHAHTGGEQQICYHEQALKRLEPDLDAMRGLITCKICQRFLSEPYGLACGHTYCYVCLDAWLVAQRKRTCPDCRASIKHEPVPSYLIREMTRVFAYRAELLPDGETVEEHDEYIREAVAKVAGDKQNGGLFRGLFQNERMRWMPLHDPGDQVDRCPNCHWELEEGVCGSCGLHIGDEDGFGDDTGSSESDSDNELDNDLVPRDYDGMDDPGSFDEDDFMTEGDPYSNAYGDSDADIDIDIFGPMPIPAAAVRRNRHRPDRIEIDSEPESEDSEDPENDPQMEGFLVDEEPEASDSDSSRPEIYSEEEAEETPRHRPRQLIRPTVIDSDDEDEVPPPPRRPVVIDSDSDEDEEGPVARNSQRPGKVSRGVRRQQVHAISSDEDTSSDDGGDGLQEDDDAQEGSQPDSDNGGVNAAPGGFSPLQSMTGESQADDDDDPYGGFGIHDSDDPDGSDGEDELEGMYPNLSDDAERYDDDGDNGGQYMDPYGDADDGGRSTTAGFAGPSLSCTQ